MPFTDTAVAALRRQGFKVDVNKERDSILGYKHDSVAAVFYDPLADARNRVSVVTGAVEGLEAERLRQEIQADVSAGREGGDCIYEMWRQPTNKQHFFFSAISPDRRFFLLGTDPYLRSPFRLGDLATGKELHQFPGHSLGAFTPDSKQILAFGPQTGEKNHDLFLWDVATGKEVCDRKACE
jgi:hypothetical protein